MVKIAENPIFITKLETAGKTSTEIAEFVTITKTATKAEVVGFIPKIIKIFKKV